MPTPVDESQMIMACMLHVLNEASEDDVLTMDEINSRMEALSQDDKNAALARFEEHGGENA